MIQTDQSKRYPKLVLLVMMVFFSISLITNILNSILADVKVSFELSLAMAGWLPFSFFVAYGVMSIPAGFLVEKYSDKRLLITAFVCIAIASVIFAFFPSFGLFSITLFLLGCSMAVLQVIINPMLRVAGGEADFAFNSVLAQLVFGLASFVSPYLYIGLVSEETQDGLTVLLRSLVPADMPWVSLYLIFALIALLFWLVISRMKFPEIIRSTDEQGGGRKTYTYLLSNKYTLLFFLGIFCYVGTEQGIGNWISEFLYQYHGLDPQTTGASTVSYFWGLLTVGCLLGLLLLKLLDSRMVLIGSALLAMGCLFTALTAGPQLAVYGFAATGFSISVMWSIIFSLGLNSVREHHGALSGILCTGIAGGAILPLIVGMIGDSLDLRAGMYFLFIPLAFILSIGFWAKPLINNRRFKKGSEDVH
ncbi:MFS transporter [Aureitalea marina]|uniref:MFS transporter n=1 Tax=Aureitalea marina TaxID=930804 RepID=A0A2S7KNM4_9FLAO|nr:MFS transporter [Aureitalea marina]PQB04188.1 MFS transporter [Aureitalea marina]